MFYNPLQDKPCKTCVHSKYKGAYGECLVDPRQPQVAAYMRSKRGLCGANGKLHKLSLVPNIWAKIKAFFRIKS